MEKEGEKIIFVGVWLERRAEWKLVEWGCFLSRSTKILSPKIEEINREKKASCLGGWKNQCVKSTCSVVFFFDLFIYLFWFSSLVFVFFCTSHFFFSPILDAFLLSRSTKILSPEIEEKNKEKKVSYLCGWKNQCVKCTWFVIFFFGLFISFLVFFFVFLSFSVLLIFFLIYFGCFDLCSFLKKIKVSIHNCFNRKKCVTFVLFNVDIIVNLTLFFILSFLFLTKQITSPSSQPNTYKRKINLFYCPTFLSIPHFSTPSIK